MNFSTAYKPRHHLRSIIVTFPDGSEKYFDSIRTASADIGVSVSRIQKCLRHDTDFEGFTFRDAK